MKSVGGKHFSGLDADEQILMRVLEAQKAAVTV